MVMRLDAMDVSPAPRHRPEECRRRQGKGSGGDELTTRKAGSSGLGLHVDIMTPETRVTFEKNLIRHA